jgi:hypothetical protein
MRVVFESEDGDCVGVTEISNSCLYGVVTCCAGWCRWSSMNWVLG